MVKSALLGNTGLVGQSLSSRQKFELNFNTTNIKDIVGQQIKTLYCCAPSGNRLYANQNPDIDSKNIKSLIEFLQSADISRLVLISTVDTQHCPDTPYGGNRLHLENFVKSLPDYRIVRLSTLIDPAIKKNVLYDLKHQKFLESINLDQCMHWYLLRDLPAHLKIIENNQIKEINLVSEPIYVHEIVDKFFNSFELSTYKESVPYDLVCDHVSLLGGTGKYLYSKDQIFHFMKEYLDDPSA